MNILQPAPNDSRKERIKNGNSSLWSGSNDLSASVFLEYNEKYFLVKAVVRDDTRGERSGKMQAFSGDGIELFIDTAINSNLANNSYDVLTTQVVLGVPTSDFPEPLCTIKNLRMNTNNPPDLRIVVENTATGYSAFLAIPWNYLGGLPASGQIIGFDLALNDSDSKACEIQMIWSGEKNNWQQRVKFGRLKIK
ncbi:MAG: hypothetical protein A2096_11565 [Spirochaetes bacterium GWF1_41_5]|nr:MAG: hypothetical protein A2096_11565 [Spirochaetes bacterium GWF1_41_5]